MACADDAIPVVANATVDKTELTCGGKLKYRCNECTALKGNEEVVCSQPDLETSLEHANSSTLETQATMKKYQMQIREAQNKMEEEARLKSSAQDVLVSVEKKCGAARNALEEARSNLESIDRARRAAEQELCDSNESLASLTNTNQALTAAKRKLDEETSLLNVSLNEILFKTQSRKPKIDTKIIGIVTFLITFLSVGWLNVGWMDGLQ